MYVIPVSTAEPVRVISQTVETDLGVLRAEIGSERLDHADFLTPWGPIQLWVGGDSLLGPRIEHNLRAISLCRDFGYNVADVGGVAVITSYERPSGASVSPPTQVLDYLQGWVPRDEVTRPARMRVGTQEDLEAIIRRTRRNPPTDRA
jgi:hypothetical protein